MVVFILDKDSKWGLWQTTDSCLWFVRPAAVTQWVWAGKQTGARSRTRPACWRAAGFGLFAHSRSYLANQFWPQTFTVVCLLLSLMFLVFSSFDYYCSETLFFVLWVWLQTQKPLHLTLSALTFICATSFILTLLMVNWPRFCTWLAPAAKSKHLAWKVASGCVLDFQLFKVAELVKEQLTYIVRNLLFKVYFCLCSP